jgi:hypothetical protein
MTMGNNRMNSNDWQDYNTNNTAGKTRAQAFPCRQMKDAYNPALIGLRESRDSAANPRSTPIILGCDVTGSMGLIAEQLIRTDMVKIAEEIYSRKPIPDPHIAVMAIGDARTDTAPLQVTQFEASIVLAKQMGELFLEGEGGGNSGEDYGLAHLFAGTKTAHDSMEVRGQKGVLITIGDEPIHDFISAENVKRVMGPQFDRLMTKKECIDLAMKSYEVFHVVLEQEGYASHSLQQVLKSWNEVLPQRVVRLTDVTKLAETVVSILQVINGERKEDIAASWGSANAVVAHAIKDIKVAPRAGGIARLA